MELLVLLNKDSFMLWTGFTTVLEDLYFPAYTWGAHSVSSL